MRVMRPNHVLRPLGQVSVLIGKLANSVLQPLADNPGITPEGCEKYIIHLLYVDFRFNLDKTPTVTSRNNTFLDSGSPSTLSKNPRSIFVSSKRVPNSTPLKHHGKLGA